MRSLKRIVKRMAFEVNRVTAVERQSVLMGEIRAEQLRQKPKLTSLAEAEFSVFSQWGEDGILSWLVDVIEPTFTRFVEFGVEDYRESNTRYLTMSRNWSGLIIDGSAQNIAEFKRDALAYKHDIASVCSFITRENINDIISSNGFCGRLGILSVDIDGVDYWVLEAIKAETDIMVVEYNDAFGILPVSVPYDAKFIRTTKHASGMYWGASLSAFESLLNARGYRFVGTNSVGTNAFFVMDVHFGKIKKKLAAVKAWPCKMREVRNLDGTLSHQTYAQRFHEIANLPVINVKTGHTLLCADLTK